MFICEKVTMSVEKYKVGVVSRNAAKEVTVQVSLTCYGSEIIY